MACYEEWGKVMEFEGCVADEVVEAEEWAYAELVDYVEEWSEVASLRTIGFLADEDDKFEY